jgi:superfamily II DNA/RNA helicase
MRPRQHSTRLLGSVRATAKMYEFRVAKEDFVEIPRDPSELFSLAIGILGDATAAIAEAFLLSTDLARPETWSEEDGDVNEMVRFSATFFDAYIDAKLDEEITAEFSLLCASAYYLSENVGSAAVVARRSEAPPLQLGHGLARTAYAILRNEFRPFDGEFVHADMVRNLLNSLNGFVLLEDTDQAVAQICYDLRQGAYQNGSARELFYADLVTALCSRKLRDAARTILPPTSGLPLQAWAPAIIKNDFPKELWPSQQRICEAGLLSGRSAVIQMPTSAGKTRAAELIIRSAFLSGRTNLAIIVGPFKSLCHDIRSSLVKAFSGENISLNEVTDSYLLDIDLGEVFAQRSVLIVTPEKLLYMLRRAPELAEQIGLIIYDEGHQFEGLSRGPTYELLLSSLRMSLQPSAQVVLISAVIGNASQIADWLIKDNDAVVAGQGLLPTTKSIAFSSWTTERGQLKYVRPDDPSEQEFFVPRLIDTLPLQKLSRRERDRVFPDRDHYSESIEIGLYLGLHLVPNGSVAIFCGQKATVTKACWRAADIFKRGLTLARPLSVSNAAEIIRLAALIGAHLGADSSAAQSASLGIFGHHGNTPHGMRLAIEHAMKEGHARFVICTSTLAQGVNFPIKYLIVTATQQGGEAISVRDFHNLMGRAGRAGMHTEGSVIFSSPRILDERSASHWQWDRWFNTTQLLNSANAEPSLSAILKIFDNYVQDDRDRIKRLTLTVPTAWLDHALTTRTQIEEIVTQTAAQNPNLKVDEFREFVVSRVRTVQKIASYLASFIDFDSDLVTERIDELAQNTLAFHLADGPTRAKLIEVFRTTATTVERAGDAELKLLIRKSPLPPPDIFELQDWINTQLPILQEATVDGSLDTIVIDKALTYLTEKSVTKISDQNFTLSSLFGWMDGQPFWAIHEPMATAGIKAGRENIAVEHVVEMCESGFGFGLSMIIASIADLAETQDNEVFESVATLQKRVKHGLTDPVAIVFYEAGFSDRVVAQNLAVAFPNVTIRAEVREICRNRRQEALAVLDLLPAYFRELLDELGS